MSSRLAGGGTGWSPGCCGAFCPRPPSQSKTAWNRFPTSGLMRIVSLLLIHIPAFSSNTDEEVNILRLVSHGYCTKEVKRGMGMVMMRMQVRMKMNIRLPIKKLIRVWEVCERNDVKGLSRYILSC